MAGHDVIVVGASAGGVKALRMLVGSLPADLPAAIFLVLHLPARSPSLLPEILSRVGPLQARHPANGEAIQQGRIYVAPPDLHLLVEEGFVCVVRGPKENHHRPAIDPLFRSAARAYGPRVVGVILTGSLDDGTAGLLAIKQRGGMAVVQDPNDALFASMPSSAVAHVNVDHVLPLAEIGPVLVRLASEQAVAEGVSLVDQGCVRRGKDWLVRRFEEKGQGMEQRAALIRQLLVTGGVDTTINTGADLATIEANGPIIISPDDPQNEA